MKRIAVFASGEGTNLQALLDAAKSRRIRGEIVLVVSNHESVGAVTRAKRAGVETTVLRQPHFASPEEYSAAVAQECKKRSIDLICLAGFMQQLKAPILEAYRNRIMNIHPALLPAFGGKGMYGLHVHEAVLKSGARVSGCTIHVVDEVYDHGPIISQHPVPVLPDDTPATLAARVRAQEHWAYPEAVKLYCEDRIEVQDGRVRILPSQRDNCSRIRRALVSVSDKAGMAQLCRGLEEMGVEIISTSGTAKALRDAGVEVRLLDSLTGFPEILSGRVKTLHPKVHGGILLRRRDPEQVREAALFGLEPIDMVVVNLYPFAQAAAAAPSPFNQEVIEQIDIGGVTLIRSAAKNFEDVAVVVSPDDYPSVLKELEGSQGRLSLETRRRLALTAFKHTAGYDAMISTAWSKDPASGETATSVEKFPSTLDLSFKKVQDLRYGENPHQQAALYAPSKSGGKPSFEQLHGKDLSYNNLLDAAGTWEAVTEFQEPAVVIFKHVTPCGVATGESLLQAFEKAWACDPTSAFGGVMAVNRPLGKDVAELVAEQFVEVIMAPAYEPGALELLKKKPNIRLLTRQGPPSYDLQLRSIGTEVLVAEPDRLTLGNPEVVTKRQPTAEEETALRFAWIAAKYVKSNAVVLAGPDFTVGIGAGQMSRVDSVKMAAVKYEAYRKANPAPSVLVLASDAFFPFRDGVDAARDAGATAIIAPGGSVRDAEVVAAADEHGIAMVFTGMRHFRH